jgi:hypothetical protein
VIHPEQVETTESIRDGDFPGLIISDTGFLCSSYFLPRELPLVFLRAHSMN